MDGEMRHALTLGGRRAAVYSQRPVGDEATARNGWRTGAGLVVLVALSLAGDLAAAVLGLGVPGPILGLAVFLLLLGLSPGFGALTLPAARALTRLLGALIVPAAVGLAAFMPFIAEAALPLLLVLVVSTVVTGLTAALLYAGLKR
jgi:holin-like protein